MRIPNSENPEFVIGQGLFTVFSAVFCDDSR